ncbi:MAG: TatD family hydrolase [Desulfobacteraceae bacterium]|nr:TatD family hydrolase [Desulfobacteraceae bacterium]MBC2757584.1 TatD family hydrolase [Desulfobacteraceae bacterium]
MPGHLIDTHTHLCDPVFDSDRRKVIERARAAGVDKMIIVSENLTDARRNLKLAAIYPELLPAAGLYPTQLDVKAAEEMVALIKKEHRHLAAIGEVGLDYWAVTEAHEKEIQQMIFSGFIALSLSLDLPLNVHSRSAGRHAVSLLLDKGAKRVQMHAFDGKYGAAMAAVEAGFFFSIPPSIVRSRQKQKLVKQLPLSCLLIETDSPVLGPNPGGRNEPANLVVSVEMIARIKDLNSQAVAEAVSENTHRLYGQRLF